MTNTSGGIVITSVHQLHDIGSLSVGEPQMEKVEIPETLQLKQENEKLKAQLVWLEEWHVAQTVALDESTAKRYEEIARADMWRDKFIAADCERKEALQVINNLKQQHEIEMSNLKGDIQKANDALTVHYQDEQLLFLTMQKAVQLKGRLHEPVEEGGRTSWI